MTTRGFKFEEKNVENNDFRKELINMGYRGVPIIVIDEIEIVGFDKEKINQILSI
jgi:glutaredoxin